MFDVFFSLYLVTISSFIQNNDMLPYQNSKFESIDDDYYYFSKLMICKCSQKYKNTIKVSSKRKKWRFSFNQLIC